MVCLSCDWLVVSKFEKSVSEGGEQASPYPFRSDRLVPSAIDSKCLGFSRLSACAQIEGSRSILFAKVLWLNGSGVSNHVNRFAGIGGRLVFQRHI